MCGIYGRWSRSGRALDLPAVRHATTRLRHRGPDDEGFLLADTRGGRVWPAAGPDTTAELGLPPLATAAEGPADLALGFRRLAIIDLSPAGHQPMGTADRRHWIVFNGEIYNYRELRVELEGLGHRFRGHSDTEVLLGAYVQWGEGCLERLNGMWAFAVWDAEARRLFLARDRFGIKPLFYAESVDGVAFASEAKALVGAAGVPFAPDEDVLHDYLLSGALPSSQRGETFFRGLRQLPPGHRLLVTTERAELRAYYRLPEGATNDGRSTERLVREYGELLTDAVRLQMRSDVPLGTCLSGGVDSSAIASTVAMLLRGTDPSAGPSPRQTTFSAVYDRPGARYDETAYIRRVVAATGAEPTFTVPTVERLNADLERLVWHQDEPFGSTSIFAQWCVMSAARDAGVVVLLDGQGADEPLGGYRPFDLLIADLLGRGRLGRAMRVSRELSSAYGASSLSLMARALVRQLPDAALERLRDRRDTAQAIALRSAGRRRAAPRLRSSLRNLHAHYRELLLESSLPHLLRYEDRNSMASSVESRVPFLDHRLVEYSLRHAHAVSIHDGWTKWVLRQAMRGRVPDEILWRRDKVGYETPEGEWVHDLVARRPDVFADEARLGDHLDLAAVRAAVSAPAAGTDQDARHVWRWLNAESWLRVFTGEPPADPQPTQATS